jgi:glycosyltransferase involved in cell wall biosynthesis
MHIGFLFHKTPEENPSSIDQVRLRALTRGLARSGARVTIVAPVSRPGSLGESIPVLPLQALSENPGFDVLKVCYHFSMEHARDYRGVLACRLVRVADERLPERDEFQRDRLLASQMLAAQRADGMIFNNRENAARWRTLYGHAQKIAIIPTGCPLEIPSPEPNPYDTKRPVMLFLGSLASSRMIHLINEAAERLQGKIDLHLIGKNKSRLYGGKFLPLSPLIRDHGEIPEEAFWDYIRYARIGLALAAGPDVFDNDLSKIMSYARGGLPILCEERIPNIMQASQAGPARTFVFGDAEDLARTAVMMASSADSDIDPDVMRIFCSRNSWSRRAEVLYCFLKKLISVQKGGIQG